MVPYVMSLDGPGKRADLGIDEDRRFKIEDFRFECLGDLCVYSATQLRLGTMQANLDSQIDGLVQSAVASTTDSGTHKHPVYPQQACSGLLTASADSDHLQVVRRLARKFRSSASV